MTKYEFYKQMQENKNKGLLICSGIRCAECKSIAGIVCSNTTGVTGTVLQQLEKEFSVEEHLRELLEIL